MTIQIDDAGWGSPIGGVLIAGYRPETQEFAVAEIAVEHFQPPRFQQRTYLDAAVDATIEVVLRKLNSPGNENIAICSGFVHDKTRAFLAQSHRPWQTVKIEGPLQTLIEAALADYLRGLGFEPPKSTEQYGALFYQAIKWLKGGNLARAGMDAERMRVAKTGWASFPFYRDNTYVQAKELARRAKNRRGLARLRREEDF